MAASYRYYAIPTGSMWGVASDNTSERAENVTADVNEAEYLALLFTACQLSPVHLDDVIHDYQNR